MPFSSPLPRAALESVKAVVRETLPSEVFDERALVLAFATDETKQAALSSACEERFQYLLHWH